MPKSLLSEGIAGMKIWPIDLAAQRTTRQEITAEELAVALRSSTSETR